MPGAQARHRDPEGAIGQPQGAIGQPQRAIGQALKAIGGWPVAGRQHGRRSPGMPG